MLKTQVKLSAKFRRKSNLEKVR